MDCFGDDGGGDCSSGGMDFGRWLASDGFDWCRNVHCKEINRRFVLRLQL